MLTLQVMQIQHPIHIIKQNTDFLTKSLEELSIPILSWFKENKYKPTLEKCHLIVSNTENANIILDDFIITLFSMIDSSSNITLKTCARRQT